MKSAHYRDGTWEGLPGLREARRLCTARKGPPSEFDRPQPRSHRPKVLPGQIDIFGNVHGLPQERDEEPDAA
jgi:hypothetical protein